MRVVYIVIKVMEGQESYIDKLVRLGPKMNELFSQILFASEGTIFISGGIYKDKIIRKLKIAEPTYYKRLKILSNEGLLFPKSKGVYTINSKWAEFVLEINGQYIKPSSKSNKKNQYSQ